jgi:hypothetical protein
VVLETKTAWGKRQFKEECETAAVGYWTGNPGFRVQLQLRVEVERGTFRV